MCVFISLKKKKGGGSLYVLNICFLSVKISHLIGNIKPKRKKTGKKKLSCKYYLKYHLKKKKKKILKYSMTISISLRINALSIVACISFNKYNMYSQLKFHTLNHWPLKPIMIHAWGHCVHEHWYWVFHFPCKSVRFSHKN